MQTMQYVWRGNQLGVHWAEGRRRLRAPLGFHRAETGPLLSHIGIQGSEDQSFRIAWRFCACFYVYYSNLFSIVLHFSANYWPSSVN